jgi:hypothetical protein
MNTMLTLSDHYAPSSVPSRVIYRRMKLQALDSARLAEILSTETCSDLHPAALNGSQDKVLFGSPVHGIVEKCEDLIVHRNLGHAPRRRFAVRVIAHLLSASSEHFLTDGLQNPDKVKAWSDATVKWLVGEFGESLISAVLQCNDGTPHIHAITVVDPDDARRGVFSSITELHGMHSRYGSAVAHLNLKSGVSV